MLKKILQELKAAVEVLWRIYWAVKVQEDLLRELKDKLTPPEGGESPKVEYGGKDPDAWMHAGIANILGYQPGKSSKEGEE